MSSCSTTSTNNAPIEDNISYVILPNEYSSPGFPLRWLGILVDDCETSASRNGRPWTYGLPGYRSYQ
jgi:hypothetical protein